MPVVRGSWSRPVRSLPDEPSAHTASWVVRQGPRPTKGNRLEFLVDNEVAWGRLATDIAGASRSIRAMLFMLDTPYVRMSFNRPLSGNPGALGSVRLFRRHLCPGTLLPLRSLRSGVISGPNILGTRMHLARLICQRFLRALTPAGSPCGGSGLIRSWRGSALPSPIPKRLQDDRTPGMHTWSPCHARQGRGPAFLRFGAGRAGWAGAAATDGRSPALAPSSRASRRCTSAIGTIAATARPCRTTVIRSFA